MEPVISIVVPIYNVENYIDQCLESILKQSFQNFEIICIDDGSTDQSYNIAYQFGKRDSRIKLIKKTNEGLSATRNLGIQLACGRYICFVDSDDMLVDNALQTMFNAMQKDSLEILTYEMMPLLYEEGAAKDVGKEEYYHVKQSYPEIRSGKRLLMEMMQNYDFIESACLMLIKKDFLMQNNIYFEVGKLFEDSIFSVQCHVKCKRLKHISDQLYIYRVRKNSIMTEKYKGHHLFSRLWQFSEYLKCIYLYANNEIEVAAFVNYAEQSMRALKTINMNIEPCEREKAINSDCLFRLLAHSMELRGISINMVNKDLYLLGFLEMIRNSDGIILYGAGTIGKKILLFLKQNALKEKVIRFVVSLRTIDNEHIDGLDVRCIDDEEVKREKIIICAGEVNRYSMMQKAQLKGYSSIYVIDDVLEQMIDDKLRLYVE